MAYPGRSPLAPPPFPGLETPGAPRSADISNLTARDLVAMPTRGGVTIRTAAEAEAEAEPDPEAEVVGGGSPDDDPCFAAGDDAGNAAAPPETVMVPDTFAVDDDAREPFASGFAFRGGSQEPLPSPAAMAVDERAAPLDLHSRGRTANADPKTPAGGFGGFAAGGGFDDTAEKPAASRFLDDSAAKAKAPPSAFGGFSTGSGKAVEVSAEAMAKAAAMLDGGEKPKAAAAMFSTGSGKAVEVSAEAMAKAAAMLDGGEKPKAAAAMFSTGSGKAVEVSAEAMAKAAAMLDGGEKPKAAAAPNRAAAPARFVSPAASPAPAPRPAAAAPAPAPKSRAAAPKSAGFQSPMLAGAPRPALAKRRLDVAAATAAEPPNRAAPASRFQKQKTASKTSGAPSVHDLFASRGALREGYASFFRGLAPRERLPTRGSPPSRLGFVSSDLAAGFRVVDAEGRAVGARELRRRMLAAGCVSRLLDPDWVQNAYRWVVWHHVCVVRSFPETLTDGLLTASAVEQRLLYRYERETLRAARPFLRRVWERDAPASAPAVLVVAAIRRLPNATIDKERGVCENNENVFLNGAELELSDGWYGAPARCDAATTSLVNAGAIRVGSKLLVQGLELLPKDGEPANPLADEALDSFLALRRNQVRPAPWDAKLGARRETAAFPLRSVAADGGAVKKILLHVERVYPSTWVESDRPDGKTVHRSELAEKRALRAWEEERAAALERLQDAFSFANENDLDEGASEAPPRRARAALETKGLFRASNATRGEAQGERRYFDREKRDGFAPHGLGFAHGVRPGRGRRGAPRARGGRDV
jgi:breast cancer 2 susceptibility protein